MNDIEREILLLIVMTDKAKAKLKKEGIDNIGGQLGENNIRFYKKENNDKNRKDSGEKYIIALPLASGNVLLLRKKEENNYFVCLTIVSFPPPSGGSAYYYELPSNVRCRVVSKVLRSHLLSAIDCDSIKREVLKKKLWWPFEGGGPEVKKWEIYLERYESMVEGQCFGLPVKVHNINVNGKTAEFSGMPDNDSAENREKITKARNSDVSFSLTLEKTLEEIEISGKNYSKRTFGTLKSFNNGRMKSN